MLRLIAVLEEFFVYTSGARKTVDINFAAGMSLEELRRLRTFYEEREANGQEAGSSEEPVLKAI